MTWFRIDDGWANHPKVRRAGKDGRGLWVITGTLCSGAGTDGLVDPILLRESYAPLAGVQPRKAAAMLVGSELWHDHDGIVGCERCSLFVAGLSHRHGVEDLHLADGWFVFHDWSEYQPPSGAKDDPIAKLAERRARNLRRSQPGKDLQERVRRRDRDMCRYCGVECLFGTQDRKSSSVGTFDHVDPFDFSSGFGGNSMANVVVACNGCNGRKGQRTPEQWVEAEPDDGFLLFAAPGKPSRSRPDQRQIRTGSGSDHGSGVEESAPDRDVSSRDARPGTGLDPDRVGSLIGSGSGSGRNGSGPMSEGVPDGV